MHTTASLPDRSARVVASARVPKQAPTPPHGAPTEAPIPPHGAPTEAPIPQHRARTEARRGPLADWYVPTKQTRLAWVTLAEGGYVGATLILGGIAVLVGLYLPEPTQTRSVTLLAALTVVLGAVALAVAGGPGNLHLLRANRGSMRRHTGGILFVGSACTAAAAAGLLADGHAWFAASAFGIVVATVGYAALPTIPGLLAGAALGVVLAVSTVEEMAPPTPLSVGAVLMAVGSVLIGLCVLGLVWHRDVGIAVGAVIALVGAQQPLARADTVGWAYALTLLVGLACLVLYLDMPVTTLTIVGVLGVGVAVLEATWDLTTGPVGVAATLVTTGAALLVASAVGLHLWRSRGGRRRQRRLADVGARITPRGEHRA
jgi:hypothetical protein